MKIVIAGETGEGKTTIAKLIVETLEKSGIFIKDINDKDYLNHSSQELYEKRLDCLKGNLKVVIETINIVKPGYDSRNVKNARPGIFTASDRK